MNRIKKFAVGALSLALVAASCTGISLLRTAAADRTMQNLSWTDEFRPTTNETKGHDHSGWTELDSDLTLQSYLDGKVLRAGSYYLGAHIKHADKIEINGEVNLCLNGYRLQYNEKNTSGDNYFITVTGETAHLTLFDCYEGEPSGHNSTVSAMGFLYGQTSPTFLKRQEDGVTAPHVIGGCITPYTDYKGSALGSDDGLTEPYYAGLIKVSSKATFTMLGGTLAGGYLKSGAAILASGGTTELQGGAIVYCYATEHGGAISLTGGTINLQGTEIAYNSALKNGSAVEMTGGKFNHSAGLIHYNYTPEDGTIEIGANTGDDKHGEYTLSDFGAISENLVDKQGGGVYVAGGGYFNMKGGKVEHNQAESGAGVYIHQSSSAGKGVMHFSDGSISQNYGKSSSGGIRVNDGILQMTGGAIENNTVGDSSGGNGPAIHAEGTAAVLISGGTIRENQCDFANADGTIYITNNSTLVMAAGSADEPLISGNETGRGGGVCVAGDAKFYLFGGTISENTVHSGSGGGGVRVVDSDSYHGVFEMYGGTISKNTATGHGGAIYVGDHKTTANGASVTLYGGTISENKSNNTGGAIFLRYKAEVSTKTAEAGALSALVSEIQALDSYKDTSGDHRRSSAIAEFAFGIGDVEPLTITGNIGRGAGGITATGGTLRLEHGTVTGSVDSDAATPIYEVYGTPVDSSDSTPETITLYVGGDAKIGTGNPCIYCNTDAAHTEGVEAKLVMSGTPDLDGAVTLGDGTAYIVHEGYTGSSSHPVLDIIKEAGAGGKVPNYTLLVENGGKPESAGGGQLYDASYAPTGHYQLAASMSAYHIAEVPEAVYNDGTGDIRIYAFHGWETTTPHGAAGPDEPGARALAPYLNRDTGLTVDTTYTHIFYLYEDLTLGGTLTVTDSVTICLNGHVLKGPGSGSALSVAAGGALSLCDCAGELPLSGNVLDSGDTVNAGVVTNGNIHSAGTFDFYGGAIAGNTMQQGGGLHVESGTATLRGGVITKNKATNPGYDGDEGKGGGVYVASGTFRIMSGEIASNTAQQGGGVYVDSGAVTMIGGAIKENKETTPSPGYGVGGGYGGGVYFTGGTFRLESGEISGNEANHGGGVYVGGGTCEIAGGEISTNKGDYGGGLGVAGGTVTMTGGSIAENDRIGIGYGGGVHISYGRFELRNGEISGNQAYGGGGVYVDGGVCEITGGEISNNQAYTDGGGGVYVGDGACRIDGGKILNNTLSVGSNGGGVKVGSGGECEIKNSEISDNHGTYGGGVDVSVNGKCTIESSKITNNTANSGAGVCLDGEESVVTICDVAISENQATDSGGGVYIVSGTCQIEKGLITGNTAAEYGGGVGVNEDGACTIEKSEITDNQARSGGGVEVMGGVSHTGTVTIGKGTVIAANSATERGGGVYVPKGECKIEGGEISGNTARLGGGVYVDSDGTIEISDGTISAEKGTAAEQTDGVLYLVNCTAKISGGTVTNLSDEIAVFVAAGTVSLSGSTAELGLVYLSTDSCTVTNEGYTGDCLISAPLHEAETEPVVKDGVTTSGGARGSGGFAYENKYDTTYYALFPNYNEETDPDLYKGKLAVVSISGEGGPFVARTTLKAEDFGAKVKITALFNDHVEREITAKDGTFAFAYKDGATCLHYGSGTDTVSVTFTPNPEIETADGSGSVTGDAVLTMTQIVLPAVTFEAPTPISYDGKEHYTAIAAIADVLIDGTAQSLTLDGTAVKLVGETVWTIAYRGETGVVEKGKSVAAFSGETVYHDFAAAEREGTVTIVKRKVVIQINSVSAMYGDAARGARLSCDYAKDTPEKFLGNLGDFVRLSTAGQPAGGYASAGSYPIVGAVTAAGQACYEVTFLNGTFTIERANLTLGAYVEDVVYGTPISPAVTGGNGASIGYYYTGTANDGSAYASANAPTAAGSYTLTATAVATQNYNSASATCEFTIHRAETVISGSDISCVYDGTEHVLEASINHTEAEIGYSAHALKDVGSLTVKVTVPESPNYLGAEAEFSLSVTPKPVVVHIADTTVKAGDPEAEIAYTVEGAVEGDDLGIAVSRAPGTEPGRYPVSLSWTNANYDVTYNEAYYTIELKYASHLEWRPEGSDLPGVMLDTPEGVLPDGAYLVVTLLDYKAEDEIVAELVQGEILVHWERLARLYDVGVYYHGVEIEPTSAWTVHLLLPDWLKEAKFDLVHLYESEVSRTPFEIETVEIETETGVEEKTYLVFDIQEMESFFITYNLTPLWWLILLLIGIFVLEVIWLIVQIHKHRKYNKAQREAQREARRSYAGASVLGLLPMLLLKVFYVPWHVTLVIGLLIVDLVGLLFDIGYLIWRKNKEKKSEPDSSEFEE